MTLREGATMTGTFAIGLPRMHLEPGERRAFLPSFVARLEKLGYSVVLENTYGSELGLAASNYLETAPNARFAPREEAYRQDYVLVLRYPVEADLDHMQPGACLITMAHYPTRPDRVADLRRRGLEAISLDGIKDDSNRRLVENLKAVGWNGMEAAFKALRQTYPAPGFESPNRPPIHVTLLGAGAVGGHALHAAVRYADTNLREQLARKDVPGVQVTVVDYDVTPHEDVMRGLLSRTDILVDATQRPDPTQVIIPNVWIAGMPEHAILLDLSVDPYDYSQNPPFVKGIEGMPNGNLDQYVFDPDDPVYDHLAKFMDTTHRRTAVSCYSWPGVYPRECMRLYGRQLHPLMRNLIDAGGVAAVSPQGRFFQRALARAKLSNWETVTA
jgi:alanine dehydrogenase